MVRSIFVVLLILFSVGSIYSDTNGVWHRAEDVIGGVFGADEDNKAFSFVGKVTMNDQIIDGNDNLYFIDMNSKSNLNILGLGYLDPKLGDGNPYSFIRFGNPNNYYAGFMWNNNSASYGDGDDFAIFTYSNRDIVLRPGSGKTSIFSNLYVTGSSIYIGDDGEIRDAGTNYIYTPDRFDSGNQIRAPIFYDRDNSGYYINPASTSFVNRMRSANGGSPAYSNEYVTKSYVDTKVSTASSENYLASGTLFTELYHPDEGIAYISYDNYWIKLVDVLLPRSGTIRVTYTGTFVEANNYRTAYFEIRHNGVRISTRRSVSGDGGTRTATWTETITVPGTGPAKLEFWAYPPNIDRSVSIKNIKIEVSNPSAAVGKSYVKYLN